jgi:hypothetical protein
MEMPDIKDLGGDANPGHCPLLGFGLNYLVAPEVEAACVTGGFGVGGHVTAGVRAQPWARMTSRQVRWRS